MAATTISYPFSKKPNVPSNVTYPFGQKYVPIPTLIKKDGNTKIPGPHRKKFPV